MKSVYISTLTTAALLIGGATYANDLVDSDPFFNTLETEQNVVVENLNAASTFNVKNADEDIFEKSYGAHNPR